MAASSLFHWMMLTAFSSHSVACCSFRSIYSCYWLRQLWLRRQSSTWDLAADYRIENVCLVVQKCTWSLESTFLRKPLLSHYFEDPQLLHCPLQITISLGVLYTLNVSHWSILAGCLTSCRRLLCEHRLAGAFCLGCWGNDWSPIQRAQGLTEDSGHTASMLSKLRWRSPLSGKLQVVNYWDKTKYLWCVQGNEKQPAWMGRKFPVPFDTYPPILQPMSGLN